MEIVAIASLAIIAISIVNISMAVDKYLEVQKQKLQQQEELVVVFTRLTDAVEYKVHN
jgi:hypothetical protein